VQTDAYFVAKKKNKSLTRKLHYRNKIHTLCLQDKISKEDYQGFNQLSTEENRTAQIA
jgi:hypothetical protein